ncbi:MAG: hypothetical protein ACREFL_09110 [Stellaceae bacterium]
MRGFVAVSLALALIGSSAAFAAETSAPEPSMIPTQIGAPKAQTQGGISFVVGGVGDNSQDAMRRMERDYNLRLTFVQLPAGEYLADIGITVQNAKGKTLLDTTADGPFFYAQLPPGRYKVSATSNGRTLTRSIAVTAGNPVRQSFYWPKPG